MWTAIRLLTVCMLGVSGLFALRSGLPSHSLRPQPPEIHTEANDVAVAGLITRTDDPPTVELNEKKIVTIERFHVDVTAVDPNEKASAEPGAEAHHRRHQHHYRWHRRRHRRR